MKKIDWEAAYGPATDALQNVVVHALHEEEKPVKRKSITALVVAMALVVILACGAVASQFGLLDFIYTYDRGSDVSGLITQNINITGDMPKTVDITAVEAYYDGQLLHLMLRAAPKDADTALISNHMMWTSDTAPETPDVGTKLKFEADGIIEGAMRERGFPTIMPFFLREDTGLRMLYNHMMPEGVEMDSIEMDITVRLTDLETNEVVEETTITVAVPKTAEPTNITFEMDRDLESAHMDHINLIYTPMEMNIALTYNNLWRTNASFGLVGEDGTVQQVSTNTIDFDYKTNVMTERMVFTAPAALPEKLVLWIYNTDEVLVLHPQEGTVTVHPAQVEYIEGIPSLGQGMAYHGDTTMKITYDEEVSI